MKFVRRNFCRILLILSYTLTIPSQAQVDSANLKGTVYDTSRAVIPGASVTASDEEKGITRETSTDRAGQYQLLLLRPGTYTVKVLATGFEAVVQRGVILTVGQTVSLDFETNPGRVNSEIEVSAAEILVETEMTQQASTIEERRIAELPINRRDFLDFALLTPGVTPSDTMVDDTDFRVSQAPQSGLSFAGSNGRRNHVSIDGATNVYNTGGVRPTITQAAVQEFQINRSNYTAEFGGATGGVVNIVSKSGTNALHGEIFGFFRHRSLQARNFFDEEKPPFTRLQSGFAIGGPIRRDKTFFFAGFEMLNKNESTRVPILSRDPGIFSRLTDSQSRLLNFLDTQPISFQVLSANLRRFLVASNFPSTVSLFQSNSGVFPFRETQPQMVLKFDHSFSPRHFAFLRDNWTNGTSDNTQFGALIGFNRGRRIEQFDHTTVLSDTFVISPQKVNQFRFSWGYNTLSVIPVDPIGPEIDITGYGFFGRDIFLPSKNVERGYQFQENLTYARGAHTVKLGAEYYAPHASAHEEVFFSGRFSFGEVIPLYALIARAGGPQAFLGLNDHLLNTPGVATGLSSSVAITPIGVPGVTAPMQVSVALATSITALQSYNLGLPAFYQQGFGDAHFAGWSHRFFLFVQDDWKPKPNFTVNVGLRHEIYSDIAPIGLNAKSVGPRIGFSWDPFSTGKTAVRAGYGLYYSPIDSQILQVVNTLDGSKINQTFVPLSGVSGSLNPKTGQPLTSADIYQTLLSQGVIGQRLIRSDDLRQFGLTPGPGAPHSVLFRASKDYTVPYSQQASLGIERQVGNDFQVSASYLFNRAARLPRPVDVNVVRSGKDLNTNQPIFAFRDPLLLQLNQYESTANSFYHAMILSVTKRFSSHYSLSGFYTLSKAIDEVTDFNSDYAANDQTDLRADRALSSFDQRHRVVINGILETSSNVRSQWKPSRVFANLTFSPILTVSSARPFNLLVGFDNIGDHHPTTHRPFGAGRNIGRGPDLVTLDWRVSRRMQLTERWKMQWIAEVFNLFNRTNFKSINNTVGDVRLVGKDLVNAAGQSIHNGQLEGNKNLLPTQPLGFTSAFDSRQFQLGLKILF